MNSQRFESTLSKLLLIGPAGVSLFLVINIVSDPVNAPKMAALGSLGFACAGLVLTSSLKRTWGESKTLAIVLFLFVLTMLNAVVNSKSPLSQNLFGVYGRNTGFVTYLSLAFVLLGALQVRKNRSFEQLIYGLYDY